MKNNRKILQSVVEAPARLLDNTEKEIEKIGNQASNNSVAKWFKRYWKTLGPGLVSGAADDDPAGVATYSQAGAKFGFQLLWLSLFTLPLMAVVQEICARIALVTGRGLANNIRHVYSKRALYVAVALLCIANIFNIGADLGAMAAAVKLILPGAHFIFVIILLGIFGLVLEIFLSYKVYARYLKWFTLILFSYVVTMLILKIPFSTLLDHATSISLIKSKDELLMIAGILGTTISPYLFFWQSAQEIEEKTSEGKTTLKTRKGVDGETLSKMRTDVWSGMFLSNFVMFSIIAVCASTLFVNGINDIDSAAQAAEALRPLAGNAAYTLFALGIIGTGMLAIPVLAGSTAYAISETFGWREGLYRTLHEARAFYGVIIISVIIGIFINFLGIHPIRSLIYSAILNALVSPVMLIFIMMISNSKKIMGTHRNRPITSFVGWFVTILMLGIAVSTIISFFVH